MIVAVLLSTGAVLIAYALYKITVNNAQYFRERNIKYTGALSGLKNIVRVSLGKIDFLEMTQKMYNAFPDEAIYGAFDLSVRQYVVRDPEAYKQIAIKDFDHFEDHRAFITEKVDKVWGNSLIALTGEKWRQMRATLSPAFTGSKMRQMFELVSECAEDIVEHFKEKSRRGEKINIEMKDFFSRYTNDVIATCAFGIKTNSFVDKENYFFVNGKEMMNFNGFVRQIKFVLAIFIPKMANLLKLNLFDNRITESFKGMILDTMTIRHEKNIIRPDMINMLMQVRQGTLNNNQADEKSKEDQDGFATVEESAIGKASVARKWNDNEIVAQCLLFFFAGFETSSTMLTFAAYELVANPEVQQKLYEEIAEVNEQLGGKRVSYEAIQKMKYLDQVICETLRKWPAAVQTDRLCVKDYLYDDGKLKFKIEKGSVVLFSQFGIQRDPKYFPKPEVFDPDRFSDENKHNIVPGSYVPFGVGPRNCIGSRFALMELKAILYHLLLNFSFEVNKDTQIPLKLKKGLALISEKGVHLELRPRV